MPLNNRLKEYRAKINVVTLALKIAKVFNVSVEDIFSYEEDEDNE
ncbi:MAG: hypothetical protein ACRDD7_12660 [Peptostreptococcaceae bacterium]